MKLSDFSLQEPLDLPLDRVDAFLLDGKYVFRAPVSTAQTLRSVGIRKASRLSEEMAGQALALMRNPKTFGGEPARCFIPRHGLKFTCESKSWDILICFECFWVYFFTESQCIKASLSEAGVKALRKIFDDIFGPA